MESNRNSIVPNLLDDDNYKIWSNCMESYLLGQDLWDVIEEDEPETGESTPDSSPDSLNNNVKSIWRKKNASALHAIQMSCSPDYLSLLVEVKSAKKAWNLLASQFSTVTDLNNKIVDYNHEESIHSNIQVEDDDKVEDDDTSIHNEIISNDGQSTHLDIQKVEDDDTNYEAFVKATKEGNWMEMEKFIGSHPEALTATVFPRSRTALHFASEKGLLKVALSLVDRMGVEDLEKEDENGYTALIVAADRNDLDLLDLLRAMVAKNPKLANIGRKRTLPVVLAARNGIEETTYFLFQNTDINVLDTKGGTAILLNRCLNFKYFDVAQKLVMAFPKVLQQKPNYEILPTVLFARTFPTLRSEVVNKPSQITRWLSRSGGDIRTSSRNYGSHSNFLDLF